MNTDPSVEFQYTKDDSAAAFQLHYTPTRFGWAICALIILAMCIAFFFFLRAESAPLLAQIIVPIGAALGGILGGVFAWAVGSPWMGRRIYAKQPSLTLPRVSLSAPTDCTANLRVAKAPSYGGISSRGAPTARPLCSMCPLTCSSSFPLASPPWAFQLMI
jgi:hypothetical protein